LFQRRGVVPPHALNRRCSVAILFTSDLHLGHQNILAMGRIQFNSIDEMDDLLISNWNKKVSPSDEIFIIGDFSYKSKHPVDHYLGKLTGRKHLIMGNHDYTWIKATPESLHFFESVDHMTLINVGKHLITLCHYPMLEWNRSRYANDPKTSTSWLIHGHIHDSTTLQSFHYIRDNLPCALNAGVDINGFEPVPFEELIENNCRWYQRSTQ